MFTAITRMGGFVTLTAFVLSACSAFRPDPYACDEKVTAIEIGSRVEFFTADTFQHHDPSERRICFMLFR